MGLRHAPGRSMCGRMFWIQLVAFFAVVAAALPLQAENVSLEFAEANQAYADGKYDQAIAGYERMNRSHGYDPAVLFNLGNAYFQTDQLGKAILSYERALLLSPEDPDVLANLAVARERAGLETPEPKWWQNLLNSMTSNQWAWTASLLLFLFVILAFISWFKPGPIGVRWWRLALFLVFVGFGLSAACAGMSAMERHYAVVTAKDAIVLQSPFAKAKEVSRLPEGERVAVDKIDKQYEQYVRVRYAKRKTGWVSREQVEAVEPDLWSVTSEEK